MNKIKIDKQILENSLVEKYDEIINIVNSGDAISFSKFIMTIISDVAVSVNVSVGELENMRDFIKKFNREYHVSEPIHGLFEVKYIKNEKDLCKLKVFLAKELNIGKTLTISNINDFSLNFKLGY